MQNNKDLDWEKALDRFLVVSCTGNDAVKVKAILKLAHLSKKAPKSVLIDAIPALSILFAGSDVDDNDNDCSSNGSLVNSDSDDVSVREAAAYCLKCIIAFRDDDDGALAIEIGRIEIFVLGFILKLFSRGVEGRFRRILVELLWCLVDFGVPNRTIVARNHGLEVVVSLLNSCVDDGEKRHLLGILSALALLREVRKGIVRAGGVRLLVEAVAFGSIRTRERACHAVGLLGVSKSVKPMLVELGVLPLIVQLFRDGDTKTKLVAGNTLGVIASQLDFIRPVAQAGVIPLLVELVLGPGVLGKEIAEDVFCVLAITEANAVAIAEQMVRVLREGDDWAKAAACDILWELAGYKHSIPVVKNSGAIPVLVELLRDQNSDVREKSSAAIAQLSYNEVDRLALVEAVPILTELLHDESDVTRDNAAEALVHFADDSRWFGLDAEALDAPSVQTMRDRLNQIQSSNRLVLRSAGPLGAERPTWDQDFD